MTTKNGTGRRPQWIRLQIHHWELLTYRLSAAEYHTYSRLFFASTHWIGKLPLELAQAAKLAGVTVAAARSLIDGHPDLFDRDGDYLVVRHAADELADSIEHASKRHERARHAAAVRWQRPKIVDAGGGNA